MSALPDLVSGSAWREDVLPSVAKCRAHADKFDLYRSIDYIYTCIYICIDSQ